jgi:DNA-binding transcriptional LysR family regulator
LRSKRHYPKVIPAYQVNSILMVADLIGQGMGIGPVLLFLAKEPTDLKQLTDALDKCQSELWLLTHTQPDICGAAPASSPTCRSTCRGHE